MLNCIIASDDKPSDEKVPTETETQKDAAEVTEQRPPVLGIMHNIYILLYLR